MDLARVFISHFEICPNLLEASNSLVLQFFLSFIFLEDKLSLYSDQENVSTNKSSYIHINLVSCLHIFSCSKKRSIFTSVRVINFILKGVV